MATEILAIGSTTATSTDVVVLDGQSTVLSLKVDGGDELPKRGYAWVELQTGDDAVFVKWLDREEPHCVVAGPATYNVKRLAYDGDAFGAVTGA